MPEKKGPMCCDDQPKGPCYPTVCLRDEALDKFLESMPDLKGELPPIEDTINCRATFEVSGMSDNEYGRSLDLKLISVADVSVDATDPTADEPAEGETADEPTDKSNIPAKTKTPPINQPAKKSASGGY